MSTQENDVEIRRRNSEFDPKSIFIRESLLRTADHNYIISRHAFLRGMALDGFWMSAQAIEKYLKASLLLNGRDTRFFTHDLVELWHSHADLAAAYLPERFIEPHRSFTGWKDQPLEEFVRYVNRFGSPDNRYRLVGYLHDSLVLQKIDQVVFFLRRTCRDLAEEGHLLRDLRVWRVSDGLPLEEAAMAKDHELRKFFFEANPFWVSTLTGRPVATPLRQKIDFQPGSLQVAIASAKRLGAENAKPAVVDLLRWVLGNVRLSRDNQSRIRRALRRLTAVNQGRESTRGNKN